MPTGQKEGPQRVVEMMGNKFQTWSYVSFTGKAQSQLDMGHWGHLSVIPKWLMPRVPLCDHTHECACQAAHERRGISPSPLQSVNPTHVRKTWSRDRASLLHLDLLPSFHSHAPPAGDADHAAPSHSLGPTVPPAPDVGLGCSCWWRCTDSNKEEPAQSPPLNYNKSFGFPWHPSRKVEGTENEVAERLAKIMYAF